MSSSSDEHSLPSLFLSWSRSFSAVRSLACSSTNYSTSSSFTFKWNALTNKTISFTRSAFSTTSSVFSISAFWILETVIFILQQSGHNFFPGNIKSSSRHFVPCHGNDLNRMKDIIMILLKSSPQSQTDKGSFIKTTLGMLKKF